MVQEAERLRREAQQLIRQLAEPRRVMDSQRAALRRAWRKLKSWNFHRCKAIWYADPRVNVQWHEITELRALVEGKTENDNAADQLSKLDALQRELEYLRSRIDFFEAHYRLLVEGEIDQDKAREILASLGYLDRKTI